ncbi:MAG: HAD hydrolase-like protein [Nanoarchaeota archaeon]|nr:HAD hydrolase-like protein [Nanoarchaeota archaeon]
MIRGVIFDFNRTLYNPDTYQLNGGALAILDEFTKRGYLMCLISKRTVSGRDEKITGFGLEKYFKKIQVIEGEKSSSSFLECAQAMNLANEEVAVIGDRTRSELSAGKKIGMKTIWYQQGKFASEFALPGEEPDEIIHKLEDALTLV